MAKQQTCEEAKKSLAPDKPPFMHLPDPESVRIRRAPPSPPDDARCFQLWDAYGMLDNIRRHSLLVAHIASTIAQRAHELDILGDVQEVRASALLHDLAKTYCLRHGGSHALLGASWVVKETSQPRIAQGVILHVQWPWKLPEENKICILPIIVLYADKRVKHDKCVTLSERFEDLLVRYGKTQAAREGIRESWKLSKTIEQRLSAQLGINLDEYSFDCRRLEH